jgi:S1-C subfamily serine protease
MSKNILKIIAIFVLGIGGGIFADQILWPYFIEKPLFHQYRLEQSPVYLTEVKEVTVQENTALTDAVERVKKTVVGVRAETPLGKVTAGSGLIVTSDGLMVTLAELVPQGSNSSFFVEGEQVSFQVLERDLEDSLALIKLGDGNLSTVSFANLEKLKLGERVFLVGTVFEEGEPVAFVNEGIVKGFDQDLIKTNIFENYLVAGSPLFNIKGEVLGLNTIDMEGKVITIPVSKIKELLGM